MVFEEFNPVRVKGRLAAPFRRKVFLVKNTVENAADLSVGTALGALPVTIKYEINNYGPRPNRDPTPGGWRLDSSR